LRFCCQCVVHVLSNFARVIRQHETMPTNIVFGLRLALGSELLHWTPNPFRLNPNPFHMDPNPFQINPNPFHSTRCPLRRESEIPGVSLQVWYLLSLWGGGTYTTIKYTTLHYTTLTTPHHITLPYYTPHYTTISRTPSRELTPIMPFSRTHPHHAQELTYDWVRAKRGHSPHHKS
jgi:hypothetical protein